MNEGRRLAGSTVVIVGTGGIGRALMSMLEPLGARVIGVNRSGRPMAGAERTIKVDGLAEVLTGADFVVLALALTTESHHVVDAGMLDRMKSDTWIVNVGRGGLVDTDALVAALQSGSIGGAALDVTDPEPLPDGHPLWELDNVLITSHTANTAQMAIPELAALVRENVERFARGEELEGLVDPVLGY
jgi:phosphoglycerate dehydrogenase-like enzyme